MMTQQDTLEAYGRIVDSARDWGHYADRHPEVPYTDEWARTIVRALLAAADEAER